MRNPLIGPNAVTKSDFFGRFTTNWSLPYVPILAFSAAAAWVDVKVRTKAKIQASVLDIVAAEREDGRSVVTVLGFS